MLGITMLKSLPSVGYTLKINNPLIRDYFDFLVEKKFNEFWKPVNIYLLFDNSQQSSVFSLDKEILAVHDNFQSVIEYIAKSGLLVNRLHNSINQTEFSLVYPFLDLRTITHNDFISGLVFAASEDVMAESSITQFKKSPSNSRVTGKTPWGELKSEGIAREQNRVKKLKDKKDFQAQLLSLHHQLMKAESRYEKLAILGKFQSIKKQLPDVWLSAIRLYMKESFPSLVF